MKRDSIIFGTKKDIQLFQTMPKCIAVLLLLNFIFSSNLLAQEQTKDKKRDTTDEIRLKLNNDGSHYLKLTILGQFWFRYNESNPGTTVLKEPTAQTFDIGIRRARFQFYGQLTDHAFFYFYFGQDNFNYLAPRKFTPFIQDALGEYKVKKGSEALIFGAGLSIISGLSRFSQPQVANIMSMDIPLFHRSGRAQIKYICTRSGWPTGLPFNPQQPISYNYKRYNSSNRKSYYPKFKFCSTRKSFTISRTLNLEFL